ncbi:MAG TPA: TonB-dependent receptor [Elusimicrobiales bacterium]|nr:TonB-dependent receptor [Elusimicrobiales bacterium]
MKARAALVAVLAFSSASLAADVHLTVVTPGRSPRALRDVPASVEVVIPEQLRAVPGSTLDEKLASLVPGLDTGRAAGDINDRTAPLTMRGFGIGTQGGRGQGRTLVLLDGVPLNNAATGGVNWNDLAVEEIDRIEILKGPASAIYGSNSMAGVVNIITKRPGDGGLAEASFGTYNTLDLGARAGGKIGPLSLGAFGRTMRSDGYTKALEADRDAYTRRSYADEEAAGLRAVYDLGAAGALRADLSRSDGVVGLGTNYRGTARGEYRESVTDLARLSWNGPLAGLDWSASVFDQTTEQTREEGTSTTRLTDISVDRRDRGALVSASGSVLGLGAVLGLDWRGGRVEGYDDYKNGKYARDTGAASSWSPFLHLDGKYFSDRLTLSAGLRYDRAEFYDGYAENTNAPGFFTGALPERSWSRLSPRASAGWKYGAGVSQYISYARGFRAGELENMVLTLVKGSGAGKWYQKPNPDLGPEKSGTYETGFRLNPLPGLYLDPSSYLTRARDFIYQITTGIVDPTYGAEKMYTNVARVRIYGFELPVKYIRGGFSVSASYAQSHSRVTASPALASIKDKELTHAPRHLWSAGLSWKKWACVFSADWSHKSRQFTDDANTSFVPGYSVAGFGVSRDLGGGSALSLRLDNAFKEIHQNSDEEFAPGRMISAALKAAF